MTESAMKISLEHNYCSIKPSDESNSQVDGGDAEDSTLPNTGLDDLMEAETVEEFSIENAAALNGKVKVEYNYSFGDPSPSVKVESVGRSEQINNTAEASPSNSTDNMYGIRPCYVRLVRLSTNLPLSPNGWYQVQSPVENDTKRPIFNRSVGNDRPRKNGRFIKSSQGSLGQDIKNGKSESRNTEGLIHLTSSEEQTGVSDKSKDSDESQRKNQVKSGKGSHGQATKNGKGELKNTEELIHLTPSEAPAGVADKPQDLNESQQMNQVETTAIPNQDKPKDLDESQITLEIPEVALNQIKPAIANQTEGRKSNHSRRKIRVGLSRKKRRCFIKPAQEGVMKPVVNESVNKDALIHSTHEESESQNKDELILSTPEKTDFQNKDGLINSTRGKIESQNNDELIHSKPGKSESNNEDELICSTPTKTESQNKDELIHSSPGKSELPNKDELIHSTPGKSEPNNKDELIHSTPGKIELNNDGLNHFTPSGVQTRISHERVVVVKLATNYHTELLASNHWNIQSRPKRKRKRHLFIKSGEQTEHENSESNSKDELIHSTPTDGRSQSGKKDELIHSTPTGGRSQSEVNDELIHSTPTDGRSQSGKKDELIHSTPTDGRSQSENRDELIHTNVLKQIATDEAELRIQVENTHANTQIELNQTDPAMSNKTDRPVSNHLKKIDARIRLNRLRRKIKFGLSRKKRGRFIKSAQDHAIKPVVSESVNKDELIHCTSGNTESQKKDELIHSTPGKTESQKEHESIHLTPGKSESMIKNKLIHLTPGKSESKNKHELTDSTPGTSESKNKHKLIHSTPGKSESKNRHELMHSIPSDVQSSCSDEPITSKKSRQVHLRKTERSNSQTELNHSILENRPRRTIKKPRRFDDSDEEWSDTSQIMFNTVNKMNHTKVGDESSQDESESIMNHSQVNMPDLNQVKRHSRGTHRGKNSDKSPINLNTVNKVNHTKVGRESAQDQSVSIMNHSQVNVANDPNQVNPQSEESDQGDSQDDGHVKSIDGESSESSVRGETIVNLENQVTILDNQYEVTLLKRREALTKLIADLESICQSTILNGDRVKTKNDSSQSKVGETRVTPDSQVTVIDNHYEVSLVKRREAMKKLSEEQGSLDQPTKKCGGRVNTEKNLKNSKLKKKQRGDSKDDGDHGKSTEKVKGETMVNLVKTQRKESQDGGDNGKSTEKGLGASSEVISETIVNLRNQLTVIDNLYKVNLVQRREALKKPTKELEGTSKDQTMQVCSPKPKSRKTHQEDVQHTVNPVGKSKKPTEKHKSLDPSLQNESESTLNRSGENDLKLKQKKERPRSSNRGKKDEIDCKLKQTLEGSEKEDKHLNTTPRNEVDRVNTDNNLNNGEARLMKTHRDDSPIKPSHTSTDPEIRVNRGKDLNKDKSRSRRIENEVDRVKTDNILNKTEVRLMKTPRDDSPIKPSHTTTDPEIRANRGEYLNKDKSRSRKSHREVMQKEDQVKRSGSLKEDRKSLDASLDVQSEPTANRSKSRVNKEDSLNREKPETRGSQDEESSSKVRGTTRKSRKEDKTLDVLSQDHSEPTSSCEIQAQTQPDLKKVRLTPSIKPRRKETEELKSIETVALENHGESASNNFESRVSTENKMNPRDRNSSKERRRLHANSPNLNELSTDGEIQVNNQGKVNRVKPKPGRTHQNDINDEVKTKNTEAIKEKQENLNNPSEGKAKSAMNNCEGNPKTPKEDAHKDINHGKQKGTIRHSSKERSRMQNKSEDRNGTATKCKIQADIEHDLNEAKETSKSHQKDPQDGVKPVNTGANTEKHESLNTSLEDKSAVNSCKSRASTEKDLNKTKHKDNIRHSSKERKRMHEKSRNRESATGKSHRKDKRDEKNHVSTTEKHKRIDAESQEQRTVNSDSQTNGVNSKTSHEDTQDKGNHAERGDMRNSSKERKRIHEKSRDRGKSTMKSERNVRNASKDRKGSYDRSQDRGESSESDVNIRNSSKERKRPHDKSQDRGKSTMKSEINVRNASKDRKKSHDRSQDQGESSKSEVNIRNSSKERERKREKSQDRGKSTMKSEINIRNASKDRKGSHDRSQDQGESSESEVNIRNSSKERLRLHEKSQDHGKSTKSEIKMKNSSKERKRSHERSQDQGESSKSEVNIRNSSKERKGSHDRPKDQGESSKSEANIRNSSKDRKRSHDKSHDKGDSTKCEVKSRNASKDRKGSHDRSQDEGESTGSEINIRHSSKERKRLHEKSQDRGKSTMTSEINIENDWHRVREYLSCSVQVEIRDTTRKSTKKHKSLHASSRDEGRSTSNPESLVNKENDKEKRKSNITHREDTQNVANFVNTTGSFTEEKEISEATLLEKDKSKMHREIGVSADQMNRTKRRRQEEIEDELDHEKLIGATKRSKREHKSADVTLFDQSGPTRNSETGLRLDSDQVQVRLQRTHRKDIEVNHEKSIDAAKKDEKEHSNVFSASLDQSESATNCENSEIETERRPKRTHQDDQMNDDDLVGVTKKSRKEPESSYDQVTSTSLNAKSNFNQTKPRTRTEYRGDVQDYNNYVVRSRRLIEKYQRLTMNGEGDVYTEDGLNKTIRRSRRIIKNPIRYYELLSESQGDSDSDSQTLVNRESELNNVERKSERTYRENAEDEVNLYSVQSYAELLPENQDDSDSDSESLVNREKTEDEVNLHSTQSYDEPLPENEDDSDSDSVILVNREEELNKVERKSKRMDRETEDEVNLHSTQSYEEQLPENQCGSDSDSENLVNRENELMVKRKSKRTYQKNVEDEVDLQSTQSYDEQLPENEDWSDSDSVILVNREEELNKVERKSKRADREESEDEVNLHSTQSYDEALPENDDSTDSYSKTLVNKENELNKVKRKSKRIWRQDTQDGANSQRTQSSVSIQIDQPPMPMSYVVLTRISEFVIERMSARKPAFRQSKLLENVDKTKSETAENKERSKNGRKKALPEDITRRTSQRTKSVDSAGRKPVESSETSRTDEESVYIVNELEESSQSSRTDKESVHCERRESSQRSRTDKESAQKSMTDKESVRCERGESSQRSRTDKEPVRCDLNEAGESSERSRTDKEPVRCDLNEAGESSERSRTDKEPVRCDLNEAGESSERSRTDKESVRCDLNKAEESPQRSRTDKESSQRSSTDKESSQRSRTDKESSQRSRTDKESSQRSRTDKESSQRSRTDKESSQRSRTDKEPVRCDLNEPGESSQRRRTDKESVHSATNEPEQSSRKSESTHASENELADSSQTSECVHKTVESSQRSGTEEESVHETSKQVAEIHVNNASKNKNVPMYTLLKSLSCHICHVNVTDKRQLKSHLKIHPKQYKCRICKRRFSTRAGFKSHKKLHLAIRSLFEKQAEPSKNRIPVGNHEEASVSAVKVPTESTFSRVKTAVSYSIRDICKRFKIAVHL